MKKLYIFMGTSMFQFIWLKKSTVLNSLTSYFYYQYFNSRYFNFFVLNSSFLISFFVSFAVTTVDDSGFVQNNEYIDSLNSTNVFDPPPSQNHCHSTGGELFSVSLVTPFTASSSNLEHIFVYNDVLHYKFNPNSSGVCSSIHPSDYAFNHNLTEWFDLYLDNCYRNSLEIGDSSTTTAPQSDINLSSVLKWNKFQQSALVFFFNEDFKNSDYTSDRMFFFGSETSFQPSTFAHKYYFNYNQVEWWDLYLDQTLYKSSYYESIFSRQPKPLQDVFDHTDWFNVSKYYFNYNQVEWWENYVIWSSLQQSDLLELCRQHKEKTFTDWVNSKVAYSQTHRRPDDIVFYLRPPGTKKEAQRERFLYSVAVWSWIYTSFFFVTWIQTF